MSRLLAYIALLPALLTAGVSFESDPRPVNRAVPGASYADMLTRIMPAVVSIRTAQVIPPDVLRRLRGRIDPSDVQVDRKTGEVMVPAGLGSGTIIHPEGYVITNRHVVTLPNNQTAETVYVKLNDRREFRAKVLGVDPKTDIAVLKVEERNLPYARFADSDKVRVGDVVLAIGNPLGVGMTVTSGIISATGRSGMGLDYEDFLQTDAAINPGNSGGPLIDFEGLANTGKVVRGLIGVFGEDLAADEAAKLNLNRNGAVRVTEVSDGLPAAKAGLRVGDIIVALDGRPFDGWTDLRVAISRRKPGETLTLSYVREGRGSLARVIVAARPAGS